MALAYVDFLFTKQMNLPTVDMSLIRSSLKNNSIVNKVIYELYQVQHQEVHRLYESKTKIPVVKLQNRWIQVNNNLSSLKEDNKFDDIPIIKVIYYEVVPRILWLKVTRKTINEKIKIELIENQNYDQLFVTSTEIDICNNSQEFATTVLETLIVRWKKYLERVYLSLMDLFIVIKRELAS